MRRKPGVSTGSDGHGVRERWFWFALPVVAVLVAGVTYALVPGADAKPEQSSSPIAVSGPQLTETPESTVELTALYTGRWFVGAGWVRELPEPVIPSPGVDCPTAGRQTHDRGAVDRDSSWVTLNVRARHPTTFRLLSVRAEIVERAQVGTGPLLLCVPAPESSLFIEPTLDGSPSFVIDGDASEEWEWRTEPGGEPEELGFGEISQTEFTAFARACDCRWRLEVEAVYEPPPVLLLEWIPTDLYDNEGVRRQAEAELATLADECRTRGPQVHAVLLDGAAVHCAHRVHRRRGGRDAGRRGRLQNRLESDRGGARPHHQPAGGRRARG